MIDKNLQPYNGRLIFDHIAKTAGSAINSWLVDALGAGTVISGIMGDHAELKKIYGGEYPVISGHLQFNGEGLDPRYIYITCLRDPIERVLSWLYFIKMNHTKDQLGDLYTHATDFIESEGQVLHSSIISDIKNYYVEHFSKVERLIINNQEKLSEAIEVIKKYDVIGFQDNLHGFIESTSRIIGIDQPSDIKLINVTRNKPSGIEVSDALKNRIAELNILDIEFYNKAIGIFPDHSLNQAYIGCKKYERNNHNRYIDDSISVNAYSVLGQKSVYSGDPIKIQLLISSNYTIQELEIGIGVFDSMGKRLFGTNTALLNENIMNIGPGKINIEYTIMTNLYEGLYSIRCQLVDCGDTERRVLAFLDDLLRFEVKVNRTQTCIGSTDLRANINVQFSGSESRNLQSPGS